MRYDANYDNGPTREGEMDTIGWTTQWDNGSQSYAYRKNLTHHDDEFGDEPYPYEHLCGGRRRRYF